MRSWSGQTWAVRFKTPCIKRCIKTCNVPVRCAVYIVGSAAARLMGLWVQIPLGHWCLVSCECWVWSGSILCDGLIAPPEGSRWVWCVWVWSWSFTMRRQYITGGLSCQEKTRFKTCIFMNCRSQCPRGLRRRFSAARLLRLWVRIPPGVWMSVCCECCVLSGRGLCDGLIIRPEESYRILRVVVCDQETSKTRRLKPASGLWKYNHNGLYRQGNKQQIY